MLIFEGVQEEFINVASLFSGPLAGFQNILHLALCACLVLSLAV